MESWGYSVHSGLGTMYDEFGMSNHVYDDWKWFYEWNLGMTISMQILCWKRFLSISWCRGMPLMNLSMYRWLTWRRFLHFVVTVTNIEFDCWQVSMRMIYTPLTEGSTPIDCSFTVLDYHGLLYIRYVVLSCFLAILFQNQALSRVIHAKPVLSTKFWKVRPLWLSSAQCISYPQLKETPLYFVKA